MKLDCDIIRDLIPSYVDEVCSEKSRAAVEEHVDTCAACKKIVDQFRMTDFSAGKLEEKELNGLKKIRSRMKRQTMVSVGLGILLLLLGCNSYLGGRYLPQLIYYMLMIVCMFGAYQTRGTGEGTAQPGRADGWLTVVAAGLIAVSIWILRHMLTQVFAGGKILGVEPEKAGPTLAMVWGICFLAQFIILGVLWYRQHKLHVDNRFRLCVCITGDFLLLVYVRALRTLEDLSIVTRTFTQMSAVVLVLGFAGTLLSYYLPRKRK